VPSAFTSASSGTGSAVGSSRSSRTAGERRSTDASAAVGSVPGSIPPDARKYTALFVPNPNVAASPRPSTTSAMAIVSRPGNPVRSIEPSARNRVSDGHGASKNPPANVGSNWIVVDPTEVTQANTSHSRSVASARSAAAAASSPCASASSAWSSRALISTRASTAPGLHVSVR
jgi:hypothetical protein